MKTKLEAMRSVINMKDKTSPKPLNHTKKTRRNTIIAAPTLVAHPFLEFIKPIMLRENFKPPNTMKIYDKMDNS